MQINWQQFYTLSESLSSHLDEHHETNGSEKLVQFYILCVINFDKHIENRKGETESDRKDEIVANL